MPMRIEISRRQTVDSIRDHVSGSHPCLRSTVSSLLPHPLLRHNLLHQFLSQRAIGVVDSAGGDAVVAIARAGLHVQPKKDAVSLGGGKRDQVDARNFRSI